MWFINLYLSSLTHLERSASSPADVNKEDKGREQAFDNLSGDKHGHIEKFVCK